MVANFKETQLADMRAGQPVSLKVDAAGYGFDYINADGLIHGWFQAMDELSPAAA